MTTARLDVTVEWPKRNESQYYMLQTASGATLPNMKVALLELTLGQEPHMHLGAHSRNHEQVYILYT